MALAGAWFAYRPLLSSKSETTALSFKKNRFGLAALRTVSYLLLLAFLFGAPSGKTDPLSVQPILDVSQSWLRANSGEYWQEALDSIALLSADSVVLMSDETVRKIATKDLKDLKPFAYRSSLGPVVQGGHLHEGPTVLVTDGEIGDPESLNQLPAGSRLIIPHRPDSPDVAISALEAPLHVLEDDTLDVRIGVTSGNLPVSAVRVSLFLDDNLWLESDTFSLSANTSRDIALRSLPSSGKADGGSYVLTAILKASEDNESVNDTLSRVVEIGSDTKAVLVSASPDIDIREVLRVLRSTLGVPVQALYRITPDLWVEEGRLERIDEQSVKLRASAAQMLIVHGDSSFASRYLLDAQSSMHWIPASPSTASRPGEISRKTEWYLRAEPMSPLSSSLGIIPFDSLAPLNSDRAVSGGIPVVTGLAGRQGEPANIVSVSDSAGYRKVLLSASGFAAWSTRGENRSADAFMAFWGSLFDWLGESSSSRSGLKVMNDLVREGDTISVLGIAADDSALVLIRGEGGSVKDSFTVFPGSERRFSIKPGLERGRYSIEVGDESAVLVINASLEWSARSVVDESHRAAVRTGNEVSSSIPLSSRQWPLVLALILLCVEWMGRRYFGMR